MWNGQGSIEASRKRPWWSMSQWECIVTGVAPSLQNWWQAVRSAVGSTPMRSRHRTFGAACPCIFFKVQASARCFQKLQAQVPAARMEALFFALFSGPHLRKGPFLSSWSPCVSSPACASCLSLAGAETGASPVLSCRPAHRVPRGPRRADADRNGVSCNHGASACGGRGAASAARCAQGADP